MRGVGVSQVDYSRADLQNMNHDEMISLWQWLWAPAVTCGGFADCQLAALPLVRLRLFVVLMVCVCVCVCVSVLLVSLLINIVCLSVCLSVCLRWMLVVRKSYERE